MILLSSRKDLALKEMQMLTGVITNDYEYLLYLLIREGTNVKEEKKKIKVPKNVSSVESLDDWFNKLEVL